MIVNFFLALVKLDAAIPIRESRGRNLEPFLHTDTRIVTADSHPRLYIFFAETCVGEESRCIVPLHWGWHMPSLELHELSSVSELSVVTGILLLTLIVET